MTHICDVTQLCVCDMMHLCVFICGTWLISCVPERYVWHDSFICVTWLIHMCDMTQLHDVTHAIHMTHSYAWNDSFICGTWLISSVTESYVGHDSFTCVTWLSYIMWHTPLIWLIPMRDMTHSCVGHDSIHLWLSRMCENMWRSLVFWLIHMALLTCM